ncbi:uncharacterized protein [Aegilops tauschii subsp. strangulata]|uniref:uncharacterized protein n=1 Tax=Aegilops tauschii subsp. strangulata TaxID=200361 RepID=UPI00098B2CD1|nr:uncharacterized protein LOC109744154 isoform X2 [Aegilops tauschii subsp. strangulata]
MRVDSVSLLHRIKRYFPRGDGSSQVLLSCKYMGFLGPIAWSLLHGHTIVAPSPDLKLGVEKHHKDRKLAQCSVKKYAEFNSKKLLIVLEIQCFSSFSNQFGIRGGGLGQNLPVWDFYVWNHSLRGQVNRVNGCKGFR